ncbi:MAG: hypothetical protein ABI763_17305, partial [Bacteroidota bacterium]
MKKVLLSLTLLLISSTIWAQSDSTYTSTEVSNTVYAIDFPGAKKKILDFIRANNIKVEDQRENRADMKVKFVVGYDAYISFDSLVSTIGYSTSRTVNTVSNYNKVTEINLELAYLRQSRDSYSTLMNKVDEKAENYLALWNEKKQIEEKIFDKERELIAFSQRENAYDISLDLYDETTTPENTGVAFVNMPGFEFSYLQIETPKPGFSAKTYQGYFLKYLFTRGKSYASLGVYKNNEINKADTTVFNELFVLGFGQDFYSRHLGRGSRKFLNLYSGYSIGGILATGEKSKASMFCIAPSIGIELF